MSKKEIKKLALLPSVHYYYNLKDFLGYFTLNKFIFIFSYFLFPQLIET